MVTDKIKIVFFGTHDFAAGILQNLLNNPKIEIVLVVTQPDKPVGRKQEIQSPPVKILAQKNNLPIIQPETLKNFSFPQNNYDLNIVCQYGLIIPKVILDIPRLHSLNVHPSLLPKYRGASPLQAALLNGEKESGVTIMLMDEKMDHGPILKQEKFSILPNETFLILAERVLPIAGNLLNETISLYTQNKITPQIQDENQATFCSIFKRENGKINWNKTAAEIYNQYRGLTPWPGIWCFWQGKRLKIAEISPTSKQIKSPPGRVTVQNNQIFVTTGAADCVQILKLQAEGGKLLAAKDFLNGNQNFSGETLE